LANWLSERKDSDSEREKDRMAKRITGWKGLLRSLAVLDEEEARMLRALADLE